ncbi:hypothetical protein H8D57_00965 [bacterium]|nr:hypothetical protein [bacterium]
MRTILTIIAILSFSGLAFADLQPGDTVPNPTLRSLDEEEVKLHEMLDKVTVLHLWKCQ